MTGCDNEASFEKAQTELTAAAKVIDDIYFTDTLRTWGSAAVNDTIANQASTDESTTVVGTRGNNGDDTPPGQTIRGNHARALRAADNALERRARR